LAPVIRMLYAMCAKACDERDASSGGNGDGARGEGNADGRYGTGGADGRCDTSDLFIKELSPGECAKAVVIYLGDVKPVEHADVVNIDAAENNFNATEMTAVLCDVFVRESEARGFPPKALRVEGVGLFACGRDIENAIAVARHPLGVGVVDDVGGRDGGSTAEPETAAATVGRDAHIAPPRHAQAIFDCRDTPVGRDAHIAPPRMDSKIALITGGAQGFGKGIAEELAAQGAYVAVADLNYEGAKKCADELSKTYGPGRAIAIKANVADDRSVASMVRETVLSYGGLDLFISNAGILIAGALPDMTKEKFELVTSVNYTGYFLGAKYASAPMKAQRSACPSYTADIIEINSKSGLEGSNKNFAYAGSKFGGLGLTQSFALELVECGIKVNAICPGNFLDGPLWSDPEKGLFRQYFDAGKVPDAKSVEDVRRYYESRVPMRRGCSVRDVARAIFYLVEQQYETGQALPVTGGQVMLN